MRNIIILLLLIGVASAGWYPTSQDTTTTGDVNAANGVFTGNMSVAGILTVGSTVDNGLIDGDVRLAANHSFYSTTGSGGIDWSNGTGAWKMPTGQGTIGGATDFNGAITAREVTLDNGYNITLNDAATVGGLVNAYAATIETTLSAYTITGLNSILMTGGVANLTSSALLVEDLSASDDIDFGDTLDVGGNARFNSLTVNSSQTLAVTTADKLTVGGVIVPQEEFVSFPYTASAVDQHIFVANAAYNITAVKLMPRVAGGDAGAVNVTIRVCDDTEAPASGVTAIDSVLNLKGSADTIQSGSLTAANVAVASGDSIAVDFSGTLTSAVGVITVYMKRV